MKLSKPQLTSLDSAITREAAVRGHTGHEDGKLPTLTSSAPSYCHPKGLVWLFLYSDVFFLASNTLGKILNVRRKTYWIMNNIYRQGKKRWSKKLRGNYKGILKKSL